LHNFYTDRISLVWILIIMALVFGMASRVLLVGMTTALLLTGCSTMQERTFASVGHFEQFQLNDALFRVSYVGNGYTRQSDAEEIALLQSARVALQHGYRYFQITDDLSASRVIPPTRAVVSFDVYGGGPLYQQNGVVYRGRTAYDRFYGNGLYDDWSFPTRIQVNYTIACSQTQSTDKRQFDAQIILKTLGPKYNLNPDGSEKNQPSTSRSSLPMPSSSQTSGFANPQQLG
jgi:hypothetical protein